MQRRKRGYFMVRTGQKRLANARSCLEICDRLAQSNGPSDPLELNKHLYEPHVLLVGEKNALFDGGFVIRADYTDPVAFFEAAAPVIKNAQAWAFYGGPDDTQSFPDETLQQFCFALQGRRPVLIFTLFGRNIRSPVATTDMMREKFGEAAADVVFRWSDGCAVLAAAGADPNIAWRRADKILAPFEDWYVDVAGATAAQKNVGGLYFRRVRYASYYPEDYES